MNRGRPSVDPQERRSKRISISLTEREEQEIHEHANRERRSASDYLYSVIAQHLEDMRLEASEE